MNRRSFFGGIAGAFAATIAPPLAGRQDLPRFGGGVTGITHVFMGPTGPVDYRLLGNLHRSAGYRGQSLMSPETLGWMRKHLGIVHTPYAERDGYKKPLEYIQWLDSCGVWRGDL